MLNQLTYPPWVMILIFALIAITAEMKINWYQYLVTALFYIRRISLKTIIATVVVFVLIFAILMPAQSLTPINRMMMVLFAGLAFSYLTRSTASIDGVQTQKKNLWRISEMRSAQSSPKYLHLNTKGTDGSDYGKEDRLALPRLEAFNLSSSNQHAGRRILNAVASWVVNVSNSLVNVLNAESNLFNSNTAGFLGTAII